MNNMEKFVEVLRNNPNHAYDFISNNGHTFNKTELIDIIKEFIYAVANRVDKFDRESVWDNVAEELAEQYTEN
jgi:hypothetical protein